jgi:hypothetical protein
MLIFLDFFLSRFWAFLGWGSKKHHTKLSPKTHVENKFQIDKNPMPIFSRFFSRVFAYFARFSARGVRKHIGPCYWLRHQPPQTAKRRLCQNEVRARRLKRGE